MSEATKPKLKAWTMRGLAALTVTGRQDFTDPDKPGLVLRVTPTGSKSWAYLYRRKSDGLKCRVTIGSFGDKPGQFSLADARAKADEFRGLIVGGKDPAGEKSAIRKSETVAEMLDAFLADHPKPTARWTLECKRIFNKDVKPAIGKVKLPELERHHIKAVLKRVAARNATATVNRTLAAVRKALSWAVQEDLLETNPASGIVTNIVEAPKDRALTEDEIAAFWKGLDDAPMGKKSRLALRLVLVTGQRPGEVCGALKSEIDLKAGVWTLPKHRTKNAKPHAVPLSPLAVELFKQAMALEPECEFVFCSKMRADKRLANPKAMEGHALSHAMRDSLEALGLASNPASPHDLRRTAATHMARLGFPDSIVGKVLNHGTELRRTITVRVYIQHEFLKEKRAALEAWASEIERLTGQSGAESNVVSLRVK